MNSKTTDLVVGISTKNCADTVAEVLRTVDRGLVKHFGDGSALIVVSDGFSTDGTREIAADVQTETPVLVTEQRGALGKGNGVRTILEIAVERGAGSIALVDGDLTSIRPGWIRQLLGPIVDGRDLVVPFYLRHRYDGVITNQIAYPLTNVLFGIGVRQPIGGEYGISGRLAERLLAHPLFPHDFGIDIFITLVATAEELEIVEAVLGVKEHESTKQYADPEELLVPMFYQVVGTLFRLIGHYADHTEGVEGIRPVQRMGEVPEVSPSPVKVNVEDLHQRFVEKYAEFAANAHFLAPLHSELQGVVERSAESFVFPLDLWVRAVYAAIVEFDTTGDLGVLDALRSLWQGRFLGLVKETEALDDRAAEAHIREQIAVFQEYRGLLRH